MGNGIAHVFAQFGYHVNLVDISQPALDKALATVAKNLDRQVAKGSISETDKSNTLNNIKTFTKLEDAVKNADLVVEAASENVEVKLSIFKQLDSLCQPNTILASNTSSISITKIAAVTKRPDKVIGMHFMNPVPVMKLIEVIRGYSTSDEVTQLIMETSKALSKSPVEVNDYPGFVANRILMPMRIPLSSTTTTTTRIKESVIIVQTLRFEGNQKWNWLHLRRVDYKEKWKQFDDWRTKEV